jgi:hypothetical protein
VREAGSQQEKHPCTQAENPSSGHIDKGTSYPRRAIVKKMSKARGGISRVSYTNGESDTP